MGTYTAITVPTQFVEANGIRFAYRRWGKQGGLPLVLNQHFTGNLDNWDPAVLDGLAKEREVIIFNNAGVASSTGEVPKTFAGMAKNAEAFIDALPLIRIDLLGFSIGGMVAQQITLDRPELIRKLILVGTAPRNHDAGNGQGYITPETAAIFGATYDPPENLWLKVFFTDSGTSQAAGRAFLKRYLSRTENRDTLISNEVVPAQIAAVGEWGSQLGERFAYLKHIKQPTLVVSGNHDVIVYTVNSLYLVQNMPNAKLILYPDANHGSWYANHKDFVFETNRFLDASDGIFSTVTSAAAFAGQHGFSIKVFTSPDDQFWVNSVIIEGVHEVMLVDAQLTKTSAEKVLQEIRGTNKPLSIIYITHEHADHFLGLEVFKEAYPRVRIIANSAVVDRINKVYQEKIDKWKAILGSGATSHVVAIEKFDGNLITFENAKIEILKNIQGDTDENSMLWIPGQRILITGDVSFNSMHVYTAETDSKARGKWWDSLNKIRALKPSVVIPGHGKVGAPLDASTAVDFTENYLFVFEEELKKAKDPDSLINAMKERFPSADLLLAIERGAEANVKP